MNAQQLINRLISVEMSPEQYAPDCRRIIRDERMALTSAVRSGDPLRIAAAQAEAEETARMWGINDA